MKIVVKQPFPSRWVKRRAVEFSDPNSPFRSRREANRRAYQRRPKHVNRDGH
jgi:hypothetical protein